MRNNMRPLGRAIDYPTTIPNGLALFGPPEWRRKIVDRIEHAPTEEDWATYRQGVELLDKLRDNPFFDEGGDYGASVEQPTTRIEIIYAETREEWKRRATAMAHERGGFPQRTSNGRNNWARIHAPTTPSELLYTPGATTWTHETGQGESK